MSLEDYNEKLKDQDGRCANRGCRTEVPGGMGSFHVDHDHVTGKIRQLLCHKCNTVLGLVDEKINSLLGLVEYLQEHNDIKKQTWTTPTFEEVA